MVPLPNFPEEELERVGFWQPDVARARLRDLASGPAEALALSRVASDLGYSLWSCPDPDRALANLDRFVNAFGSRLRLYQMFAEHPAALDSLIHVLSASQYLADILVRSPEYFELMSNRAELGESSGLQMLYDEMERDLSSFGSTENRLDTIRRFRRREILRIGAADLLGAFDLSQTASQLSRLADAVVQGCLWVEPWEASGSGLIVFALGKLGGCELNYSSDVDLLFVADEAHRLEEATEIAESLTGALEEPSGEGFLYRVDLRLRPYGASGGLVVSADMLEDYLATKAQPAERQAMLKARPVVGEVEKGSEFLERISPLIFKDAKTARRDVRALKERIERQLRSRGRAEGNVKLSPGGIRDIEFIAQALQLEDGGRHPELLTGNTLRALSELEGAGLLSQRDSVDLRGAYIFLRTVEHRLQLMDNQQVHRLPKGERELRALARAMGFGGPDEAAKFREAYDAGVNKVRAIFDRILPASGSEKNAPPY